MTEGRSTEVVRIDALVCGPEFLSLLDEPRVIAIAERIGRTGAWDTTPIVRASDMAVIAGEDIIAALCRLDIDELQVELVHDGSFDDEPGTELSPDVETRYAGGAVAAVAERTDVTPVPVWDPDAEGQRATLERVEAVRAQVGTQRAAVAAVAAETGRSEHAVKKAANRAKRAKDKVSIETWGRPQPEAWMAATAELRRALTNASNSIRTAMSALSPVLEAGVPGIMLEVTHGDLKAMAAHLRSVRPACVCAWCKNEPALVTRCVACGGRGWLGEQKMSLVPKELFPPGSAMAQGRPVELDRYKAVTHTMTVDVPAEALDEASMAPASEMTWAPLEPPVPAVHGFPYDSLGPSDGEAREAERVASEAPAPVADWSDLTAADLPQWELPPDANPMVVVPVRVTDEETGETEDGHALMPLQALKVTTVRYSEADSAPLESRSHTVEPVSAEHAEAAWDALEEANGGEPFLDVIEVVGDDDGGMW